MKMILTGSEGNIGSRLRKRLPQGSELIDKKIGKDIANGFESNTYQKDDVVIHLAANTTVAEVESHPEQALENVTMTVQLLDHMVKIGLKKIVFASSREVYGDGDGPFTHYGKSKVLCEDIVRFYQETMGIDFIVLRFSNVFGDYDDGRFIPTITRQLKENRPVTVYGRNKVLDFIHVDDIIETVLVAANHFETNKNSVFDVCSGVGTRLIDWVEEKKREFGSHSEIRVEPSKAYHVNHFVGKPNLPRARD